MNKVRKTHCARGHLLPPIDAPCRQCKECTRMRWIAARRRNTEIKREVAEMIERDDPVLR